MAAAKETLQPQEPKLQQFIPGQRKDLYHVVQGNGRNRHWRKFGVGFVNKDGSVNLVIDLFPNSHFQLRDPNNYDDEPEKEKEAKPEPEANSNGNGKNKGNGKAKEVLKEAVKKGK